MEPTEAPDPPEPAAASDPPLVLVVDNDVLVNDLLSGLLRVRGLRCESVFDGEAALERLRGGGVDVLVTDLDMPKLGGQELLGKLRELDSPPRTIVISGYVDNRLSEELQRVPAVEHILRKPFDVMEFAALVQELAGI